MAVGRPFLARLAGRAPVPVFAAIGRGGLSAVERLALDPRVRLVGTPRAAAVLLVAGRPAPADRVELARVHDALAHPRRTAWWLTAPAFGRDPLALDDAPPDEVAARLAEVFRALTDGTVETEADLLVDRPPAPWRGVGPHGQGGEGMMGGRPYGRPMAMTAEDIRDGLALDAYEATVGPFLPALPPGLRLALTLQGDLVQRARPLAAPLPQDALARGPHLSLARLVRLLELPALAERLVRAGLAGDGGPGGGWPRLVAAALRAIPRGLGRTADGTDVRDRAGRWLDALDGRPDPGASDPVDLPALLAGREWHEATLVLASLDLARLRAAALPAAATASAGAAT